MTLFIIAIVAYLLVGMMLCVKGKLATKIAYEVAITATFDKPPKNKLWFYRFGLRLGVVFGWPVFLISHSMHRRPGGTNCH